MFEEDITRLLQEVRDVRTAHQRGLGMIDFSNASGTASALSSNYNYNVTVTFDDSDIFPPICELSTNTSGGLFYSTWNSGNKTFETKLLNTSDEDPLPVVTAVASTKIISIVVTPEA